MSDENIVVPIDGNRTFIYDKDKNVIFPTTGIRCVLMEDNLSTLEDFVLEVRDFLDKGITGDEAEELRAKVEKVLNNMTSVSNSISSINKEIIELYDAIGVEIGTSGIIYNKPIYKSFTSRSKQGETNVQLVSYSNNPIKLNPDKIILLKINLDIINESKNTEKYVELIYKANVGSALDSKVINNIKLLKTTDESVNISINTEVNENKIYLNLLLNSSNVSTVYGSINIDEI